MAKNQNLVLTARLASGITSVVSIVYLVLSILGIIYYFNCDAGITEVHSEQFWSTIYKIYLQDSKCHNTIIPDITQSYTVFVIMTITLSFSVVTFFTSAALFWQIDDADNVQNFNIYAYVYIFSWAATLVVDLTLGIHFGIDVTHIATVMDNTLSYDSVLETLRQGAFYLMTIAMKGYVIHLVNLVLIILMIVYLYKYQEDSKKEMHSIFSERPLNAFDFGASILDYDHSPRPMQDISNRRVVDNFHQSQSWAQQHPTPPGPSQQTLQVSQRNLSERPFSYLEENNKTIPPPANMWRTTRNAAPPVPAPDYSPHSQRRLKSVLKTY